MAFTTIDDPSEYFQTKIYSGDGNDDRNITFDGNSDMQPDWLWFKRRNQDVNHILFDSTRGVTKRNHTNNTNGEATEANFLQAFQSDGFQVGTDADINASGGTYVAWGWKANGATETNSQSESGSQIACSIQANTDAGFSIITYTGTGGTGHTFLHGLGSAPAFFIIKRRSGAEDWLVYHHENTSDPATDHLLLNTTDATSDSDTRFDDTAPNGTEIALGNNAVCNGDGSTYVCYAFIEKQGYSRFGNFIGNNSTDGAFVYTGFKPAWLMIKETVSGGGWYILDSKRQTFNTAGTMVRLKADASTAEDTSNDNRIDFLSNGFKIRTADNNINQDATTNLYIAFAESPFVSSTGTPTTAR